MRPALIVLSLAFALAGCRMMPISPRASDPHAEIARLQDRIAVLREPLQSASAPDAERCRRLLEVSGEICRCADRICALAVELAEDSAHLACGQARNDCKRARANSDACK